MEQITLSGINSAESERMNATSFHYSPPSQNNCPQLPIMISGCIILLAGVSLIVGTANLPGTTPWDQFVLLTLAGSIVASSTAFLLNPTREPPRIVMGRAITSCVAGVVGTRWASHKIEWIRDTLGGDQILLFGSGFALGMIGFLLAYAFIRSASTRSQKFVDGKFRKYLGEQDVDPDEVQHAASEKHKRRP